VNNSISKGGAVYVEVGDISGENGKVRFNGGLFTNCTASSGRGGAVYLQFMQLIDCSSTSFSENDETRDDSYYFSKTEFANNIANNGTNVFVEAARIDYLFTNNNFDVNMTLSGIGLIEFVALDTCDNTLSSISFLLLKAKLEGDTYVFVSLPGNWDCSSLTSNTANMCRTLLEALDVSAFPANYRIEIIDAAELQDAIKIYGNALVIESANSGSYVVLVIGLSGTIYLESGKLPNPSEGRFSNEDEGANITFAMVDVKLAYKLGASSNPFIVVNNGIATFTNCLFSSAGESLEDSSLVSVYIAHVTNTGRFMMKGCNISNVKVEGNELIRADGVSSVKIEVI
jgi:hypothetical protein